MLVSEREGLSFPQLPHEDEGGALEVVPLLRHLEETRWRKEVRTELHHTLKQNEWRSSHHLQQVLLQRLHGRERFHLQHAARPVDQSRLARRSLQTEPQPPRQDLVSTRTQR